MNDAFERWKKAEEDRLIEIANLKDKKVQIQQEIDRARAINPYYPVHTMAARIGAISNKLKRMDGYDKRFL